MNKREYCRAIIFVNHMMATIYREKGDKFYYTFPGGEVNTDESLTECVVREVKEVLGIDVKPVKEVYLYENEDSVEHFYLCDWISGDMPDGDEELQGDILKEVGIPVLVNTKRLDKISLLPHSATERLYNDIKETEELYRAIKEIEGLYIAIKKYWDLNYKEPLKIY